MKMGVWSGVKMGVWCEDRHVVCVLNENAWCEDGCVVYLLTSSSSVNDRHTAKKLSGVKTGHSVREACSEKEGWVS